MKNILFLFLNFLIALSTANAQKGINYFVEYGAGGKMLMTVDSSAKNVFYDNVFQNQPNTAFNFLPEVNNINIQIYLERWTAQRIIDTQYYKMINQ